MAFKRYKRFRYRKARKNRYRRRRATRYSRRRASKRVWRYRRFPRGTEVKSVASGRSATWTVNYQKVNSDVVWTEYPMRTFVFRPQEILLLAALLQDKLTTWTLLMVLVFLNVLAVRLNL